MQKSNRQCAIAWSPNKKVNAYFFRIQHYAYLFSSNLKLFLCCSLPYNFSNGRKTANLRMQNYLIAKYAQVVVRISSKHRAKRKPQCKLCECGNMCSCCKRPLHAYVREDAKQTFKKICWNKHKSTCTTCVYKMAMDASIVSALATLNELFAEKNIMMTKITQFVDSSTPKC